MSAKQYGAGSIKVLEGLEAVRERPAMYIGDTSKTGLHHLVSEVVDNSIDEAMAGYCSKITVTIHVDERISVADDGRGIPVGKHPDPKMKGKDALEVVMTTLHAGGKFDNDTYKMSAGLHGVGVSCVNALSEHLVVEVKREGHCWTQEYKCGKATTKVTKGGAAKSTGTKVTWKADTSIFEINEYDADVLVSRLRELAFLNAGLTIKFIDERHSRQESFRFDGGLVEFVKHLNTGRNAIHSKPIHFNKEQLITLANGKEESIAVEAAIQYNDSYDERVRTYANNIHTSGGGTHMVGFRKALTATINRYAKRLDMLKKMKAPLSGDDLREGLTAVVSVRLTHPQFESQTKYKLGNSEVANEVEKVTNEAMAEYLEENPNVARKIINKAQLAAQARIAARKQRDLVRKSVMEGGGLPGKLADCSERQREGTEIYLVEGDSAGGSAKQGRDRHFQAILPLRGKILNVESARLDKILSNEEIKNMVMAIGTGFGEGSFDVEKLKYDKIIIMTDADVDGAHIRTLLLTLFYRRMPELIEKEHVYIAQPPLYAVKKGKKMQYLATEQEKDEHILNLGVDAVEVGLIEKGKKKPKEMTKTQVKQLLGLLRNLESQAFGLMRKGIGMQDYLDLGQNKEGKLPRYHLMADGVDLNLHTAEEVEKQIAKIRKAAGLPEWPNEDAEGNGDEEDTGALYDVVEYTESKQIEAILEKLAKLGVESTVFHERASDTEVPVLFHLADKERSLEIKSLGELLNVVREVGERGIQVQRYKGLGEMNPSQLWETTMDPSTRTLLRVTVKDAEQADLLFTTLMGNDVEPRRDFITANALDVQNLDV